ncbi:hypothetical protein SAMN03080603_00176 [Acetomicrobium thermoterrenum DSM 13490]|uniref:Cof subfamily of IIB subfamily of haloacid dehalogenase superfamily/HAD-superfamily hydrolase, subfamily IIB n=1 Tax=Acetomicrobium thermoterrenum DSM 13490 TaxID=1120987 RepID=A0A1H3DJ77_9BACT|nr:HAD-IIB family hydrolase [Acetomicrobium thermoterrenum]SDX66572.1 hypothetical protein SAMN03080603_00176 [Acetomicrobium thermoterrenum DSM 13490]
MRAKKDDDMKKDLLLTDRWVVVDLDGTIIRNDKVPTKVARAAKVLQDAGWSLIVATGRILAGALPHVKALKTACPAIVYDGARVMDPKTGKVYFEKKIPRQIAAEVIGLGFDLPLEIQVYGDESVICRPSDLLTITYFKSLDVELKPFLVSSRLDEEVFRVIFFGKPLLVSKLKSLLEERLKEAANLTLAGDDFLDVLPAGVSKGAALEALKEISGKRDAFIVGVGDHMNDLEMLRMSDFRAAPADALSEIREMADVIIPPSSKCGFCELCELLLSEGFEENLSRRCNANV